MPAAISELPRLVIGGWLRRHGVNHFEDGGDRHHRTELPPHVSAGVYLDAGFQVKFHDVGEAAYINGSFAAIGAYGSAAASKTEDIFEGPALTIG
ncbi:hypothetical protein [Bradyrhizobium australafricanum]|uniref:hypothetical protein n=1 Tax=Bradyrhizobium australafricanum TaxID=2821406 RepID=UPI001CE2743C|nr:hypothetical protein [Bradyrhizobium australafricanum]MCA6105402.1 hypothetical protein [Bradyrhizobium australafricanum]